MQGMQGWALRHVAEPCRVAAVMRNPIAAGVRSSPTRNMIVNATVETGSKA
jgi:hypothetical protein